MLSHGDTALGIVKWIVVLAFVVTIAIPTATILVNFGGAALGTYIASKDREEREEKEAEFQEKYKSVFNPTNDQFALQAVDNFDDFIPSRMARVVVILPDDLFEHTSLSSLMSAARLAAPTYAESECQALLKAVAAKCRVSETVASPKRNAVEIRMSLQFVQRDELGAIPRAEKLRIDPVAFEYGKDDNDKVFLAETDKSATKRSLMYTKIARDCAAMKAEYGNCSTYRIHVYSDLLGPEGKEFVRTTGTSAQSFIQVSKEELAKEAR